MRRTGKYICLAAALVVFPLIVCASENAEALRNRINTIRNAPYDYGISLGFTSAFLVDKGIVPGLAFEPYAADDHLNARAEAENQAATGLVSEVPAPPRRYLLENETGGTLSFYNFIPLSKADKFFVDHLFKKELESGNFEYILSDAYARVGAAVRAGVTEINRNAWFFSLYFGSADSISEARLLTMVNQVRSDPWALLGITGLSLVDVLTLNSGLIYLLDGAFAPLFFNDSLYRAARDANAAVIAGQPHAETRVAERVQQYGYTGGAVRGSTVAAAFEQGNDVAGLSQALSAMVRLDLNRWPLGQALFFGPAGDSGPAFSVMNGPEAVEVGVFSLYTGAATGGDTDGSDRIYGILYRDHDDNGLYSPGEEIAGDQVSVYEDGQPLDDAGLPVGTQIITTDAAGRFFASLDRHKQYVFTWNDGALSSVATVYTQGDSFVKLQVPVPAPAF